jgi:hypothetical protein
VCGQRIPPGFRRDSARIPHGFRTQKFAGPHIPMAGQNSILAKTPGYVVITYRISAFRPLLTQYY